MNEPTLCFVKGNWAYFKTEDDEVPDNWDVVPYTYVDPPQGYIKLQFCVDMEQPADAWPEDACPYSVDAINNGEIPWLKLGNDIGIMGGCGIEEFCILIYDNKGAIAIPTKTSSHYDFLSSFVNYDNLR
jgi:hypothetical protein